MDDYRRLQRTCESQAALSSSREARTALLEMAEEYRKRADCAERGEFERAAPRGTGTVWVACKPDLRTRAAPSSFSSRSCCSGKIAPEDVWSPHHRL